ncbi:MAG: hypothetical protein R3E34_00150 [Rhodocyclaceae bacterium]
MPAATPEQADSLRYVSRPVGLIHWKELPEGWVGYAERAGSTFVIDPLSRFVFDCITSAPQGLLLTELSAQLADVSDTTIGSDLSQRISMAVGILIGAQLIETSRIEPLSPQ